VNDAGRRAAFESVHRLLLWHVARVSRRYRSLDRDDLTQAAALEVWQTVLHLDRPMPAEWVGVIVGRVAGALAKRAARTATPDSPDVLDWVPDPAAPDPSERAVNADAAAAVRRAVATLPDRHRRLITQRYGLAGPPESLAATAAAHGVTVTRTTQLKLEAFGRLREALGGCG
jgi:RNA polymerase sigma factor (sigma-70 family)